MKRNSFILNAFLLLVLGCFLYWKISKTSQVLQGAVFTAWMTLIGAHFVVQLMIKHPTLRKRMLVARWLSTVYAIAQHVFAVLIVLLTEPGQNVLLGQTDSKSLIEFSILVVASILVGFVIEVLIEYFIDLTRNE